jgi:hypothetical protein
MHICRVNLKERAKLGYHVLLLKLFLFYFYLSLYFEYCAKDDNILNLIIQSVVSQRSSEESKLI